MSLDQSPASGSRHVYVTLDGLRGIAALAVIVLHIELALGGPILPHAYLAVDLFFVMSGIVIAHAYEHRLAAGMTTTAFMRLRLIRLYPVYLLGTLVGITGAAAALAAGIALDGWTGENLPLAAPFAVAMLPSYVAAIPTIYPFNPPGWSLLFELVANLAYVLFFPLLRSRVLLVLAGIAAVALGAIAATEPSLDVGTIWDTAYAGLPRVLWSFPLGVVLYRHRDRLPRLTVPPIVLAPITVAIFAPVLPAPLVPAWDLLAVLLLLPAVCIAAISNEPRRGRGVFLWLGAISYPLYILHFGLYRVYERSMEIVSGQPIERLAPWAGVLFMVLAAIAATLVDQFYDRPLRRFLARGAGTPRGLAKTR